MTRQFKHDACCPNCGGVVHISTPMSRWFRSLSAPFTSAHFDNQNLDYVWFRYREGWLITIEEKRFGGRSTSAQLDTHGVIAQMLHAASGARVKTQRGVRPIEYRGHYLVRLENTTPDNSAWIEVNGTMVTREDFMYLLLTGRLPAASLAA